MELVVIIGGEEMSTADNSIRSDLEVGTFVTMNGDNPPLLQLTTPRKGMKGQERARLPTIRAQWHTAVIVKRHNQT